MAAKKARNVFSAKEKSKIVGFVMHYNKKHGKGGQTAAAVKFGASQAAVSIWLAAFKIAKGRAEWLEAVGAGRNKRAKILAELEVLGAEIPYLRKKLATAEARYQKLKDALPEMTH